MRDLETTTPEAAAEHNRLSTPAYRDERPDESECVESTGVEADDDFLAWTHEAARRADRMLYGLSWRKS